MSHLFAFLCSLFLLFYIYHDCVASYTNFELKRMEVCNNTQRRLKFVTNVTNRNGKQYLDFNVTLPVSVGENYASRCLIETKVGNTFVELFTIRERNSCKALNKYMGEFWYDIQRQVQMAPGVCPMQEGRYVGHHIELHPEKITLQTFPFGTIRFTMDAIDKANNNVDWCILTEVVNTVN